jgi:DNA polymerase III alpha subunit
MPDIDIDFADRTKALAVLKHIDARLDNSKKHNTGVYFTNIPHNPMTGMSTVDYKTAEERGYFKLDFLNVNVYEGVNSKAHLKKLMETEPVWDLLLEDDFTDKLFHVNGHGSILREMKPQTIEQLASVLAVIRPAKRHLIGKDWNTVAAEVWVKPEGDEYYFKKAHAVAYAHVIVVQMNLICEQLANFTD